MSGPLHVAVTRRVRAGCEREFEEHLRVFAQRSLAERGSRGVQMLHPTPDSGSREYGILRSFADAADRDAFYQSEVFQKWLTDIAPLVEGEPEYRELSGLEAWFREPGLPHPPRWKMALVTLLGVYPISLLLTLFLAPHLHGLPDFARALVVAVCMIALLTWVVMPNLTKLLHKWLHP